MCRSGRRIKTTGRENSICIGTKPRHGFGCRNCIRGDFERGKLGLRCPVTAGDKISDLEV